MCIRTQNRGPRPVRITALFPLFPLPFKLQSLCTTSMAPHSTRFVWIHTVSCVVCLCSQIKGYLLSWWWLMIYLIFSVVVADFVVVAIITASPAIHRAAASSQTALPRCYKHIQRAHTRLSNLVAPSSPAFLRHSNVMALSKLWIRGVLGSGHHWLAYSCICLGWAGGILSIAR